MKKKSSFLSYILTVFGLNNSEKKSNTDINKQNVETEKSQVSQILNNSNPTTESENINRHEKFIVIIDSNRNSYENMPEFNNIKNYLEEYELPNGIMTFKTEIHWYPTFNLLDNQFCFDYNTSESSDNKIPYQKYLNDSQIKSLSFNEYQNSFKLIIDKKESLDWDCVKPESLEVITTNLINYLNQNPLTLYNSETIEELSSLKEISSFCKLIDCEILFFCEDL